MYSLDLLEISRLTGVDYHFSITMYRPDIYRARCKKLMVNNIDISCPISIFCQAPCNWRSVQASSGQSACSTSSLYLVIVCKYIGFYLIADEAAEFSRSQFSTRSTTRCGGRCIDMFTQERVYQTRIRDAGRLKQHLVEEGR